MSQRDNWTGKDNTNRDTGVSHTHGREDNKNIQFSRRKQVRRRTKKQKKQQHHTIRQFLGAADDDSVTENKTKTVTDLDYNKQQ
eukprot:15329708-Ditylum_brightwellii.AAC.1